MDADYAIELGADDPVLDFPWKDPSGSVRYVDLKGHPELLAEIVEAVDFPELKEFLTTVNSPRIGLESAKCDAWATQEISAEEEIFGMPCKVASYVDLVFSESDVEERAAKSSPAKRLSFAVHEQFAKRLVELLRNAPATLSSAEICVRRCFFCDGKNVDEGFYLTLYSNGYGPDEAAARSNWEIGLSLLKNAVLQMAGRA